MISTGRDRRAEDRFPYLCEVECRDFSPGRLRISDLSRTGAFIDTLISVRIGTILQLGFKLGEQSIAVNVEVRHCVPQIGIGVRFLDIKAEDQNFISMILAEQLSQRAA